MEPNDLLTILRDLGLPTFIAVWMLLRIESRLDLLSDQNTRLTDLVENHERNAAEMYRPAMRRRASE